MFSQCEEYILIEQTSMNLHWAIYFHYIYGSRCNTMPVCVHYSPYSILIFACLPMYSGSAWFAFVIVLMLVFSCTCVRLEVLAAVQLKVLVVWCDTLSCDWCWMLQRMIVPTSSGSSSPGGYCLTLKMDCHPSEHLELLACWYDVTFQKTHNFTFLIRCISLLLFK